MAYLTKPFFKILDVKTTGLTPSHEKTGLLQIYSTNLPLFKGVKPFDSSTFIKPASGYIDQSGNRIQFAFNYREGKAVLDRAYKVGVIGEEESTRRFFASASEELSKKRRFVVGTWNSGFDTSMLEAVTQRYKSLEQYRGFFKRKGVKVINLENPFLEFAHLYSLKNPDFARSYMTMGPQIQNPAFAGFGRVPQSVNDMRYVPGWSVENLTKAIGGREKLVGNVGSVREAIGDTAVEEQLFERFRIAKKAVKKGRTFEEALGAANLLSEGDTAESFFHRVYSNPYARQKLEQVGVTGVEGVAKSLKPSSSFAGYATTFLLAAAGLSIAYALAHSKRADRQTTITGLSETGTASKRRKEATDFGSGWQGEDNNSKRTAISLFLGASAFAAHKWAIKNWSGYAEGLYQTFKKIEKRSPSELFRTLGLSQLQSSYTVNEVFLFPEQLFIGRELTETGEHIQRLLGFNPIDKFETTGMRFTRMSSSSPYLQLEGAPGFSIRFAERGRLTGSSARVGARLRERVSDRIFSEDPVSEIFEIFKNRKQSQQISSPLSKRDAFAISAGGDTRYFEPLFGHRPGVIGGIKSAVGTTERVAFEAAERPLRLFSDVGLGLKSGSYNKLLHIPGIGEGGILNQLLLKRVLPAYLGITAAKYINYKLGNKPAEALASIPLKAHLAWAEATDKIPGLRKVTDAYEDIVPGPQYGPVALPLAGAALSVALGHYLPIARGTVEYASKELRKVAARAAAWKGAKWGALAMLPFLPGMLGSRKTADELNRIYSGEEEVPIRSGRWWEVGSTPFSGGRIKYFRPHWYSLMKAKSEAIATYGSEDAYWEHHPLLHPFKYIKDPYWLERVNYYDRPYPITSPAFSNVPLIGSALAATIGKLLKPVRRMHEGDWDTSDYTLYSPRLEPKEWLGGLAPSIPRDEFSFKDVAKREAVSFAEYTGLPGFLATTIYGKLSSQVPDQDVILQGSRQMTNWSRAYYQREIGAISGLNPQDLGAMPFGYSEPLRRFIQPEKLAMQANEIPNTMPRWLPGEDSIINFRTGDPYAKIPEGGARLPGDSYTALHPELRGIKPEDYPDIARYKILADIAPYSKEYLTYRAKIRGQAFNDTKLAIEFAKTEDQVRQLKDSSVLFDQRRFTAPVENIEGTIKKATPRGIELEEYPTRTFSLSSLGMSASDLSALALGEQNNLTRTQTIQEVDRKQVALQEYLASKIGSKATLTVPLGTEEHAKEARAVVFIDDVNINKELIDMGLASMRKDYSGAEAQAMYGSVGNALGRYAEALSFTGEGGPLRLIPTPFHTKYWNERTALSMYEEQEVYGSRMRRWQKPFHDMVAPWARGIYKRLTGEVLIPEEVGHRRDLDSLTDELDYLRGKVQAAAHPGNAGRYTSQTKRTNIGGNLFSSPAFVANTLPRREKLYFQAFLQETDPEKREQILQSVSPELYKALTAQWIKTDAMLARAAGRDVPEIQEGGILYTKEGLKEYDQASTDLSYSDYMRSKEIAGTFGKLGFDLPGPGSPLWSEGMDYEDVKLKIIQNEGYDYHDFNIYDDRAALLWRKPYVDGAVRELTTGNTPTTERLRQAAERIIIEGKDKNPSVVASSQASLSPGANISMNIDEQGDQEIMRDIRRNSDEYRSETSS